MAGMFDDLMPAQQAAPPAAPSGGMFDDLLPQKEAATFNNRFGASAPPAAPVSSFRDFFASMPKKFLESAANTLSAGGQAAQLEMGQPVDVPSGRDIQQIIEKKIGPLPEPQGLAGRLGGAVAAPFGNPLSFLAPGAAVLSGLGGQLGEETGIPGGNFVGSLLGGAGPSAFGRVISPITADVAAKSAAATLGKAGVDVTAGQATGSKALKIIENELGNAPFAGGKASAANTRTTEQFTGAVLKRAGVQGETRATPEVIDQAFTDNSNAFNSIAARNPAIPISPQFHTQAQTIADDFENLTGSRSPLLDNLVKALKNPAGSQRPGTISGDTYQSVQSTIGKFARAAQPDLKMSLYDLKGELDNAVGTGLRQVGSGQDATAWGQARGEYKNLLVLERALASNSQTASEGLITPSALANADKAISGRRAYVRGTSNFSELARAGNTILKPEANSNTSARFFAHAIPTAAGAMLGAHEGGLSLAGAAAAAGSLGIPALGGRAIMSPPMQAYLRNQLASPLRNKLGRNLLIGGILGAAGQQ